MNTARNNYIRNNNLSDLINEYKFFSEDIKSFVHDIRFKKVYNPSDKQKKMYDYWNELEKNINSLNPKGKRVKILTNKQMLNLLPILLAQIQAGNNSKSLKNELRQICSLYRSKTLTKIVYNNLIKII